jgi:hypothetical protein
LIKWLKYILKTIAYLAKWQNANYKN